MKKALAIVISVIIALIVLLLVMAVWGFHPVAWKTIIRLGISLLIIAGGLGFMWITYLVFFDRDRKSGRED